MFRLFQQADVRASDAEREQVVELLKRHYAAGRLTSTELDSRVERAYAAVGLAGLDALTRDLPLLPEPAPRTTPARLGYARVRPALLAALTALLALMVIAALPPEMWAMVLFFAVPVLFMVLPFAVPALALAWWFRSLSGPRRGLAPPPRQLGRGSGWVATWHVGEQDLRRHPAGYGHRRGW